MTCDEAIEKLKNLQMLKKVYIRMYKDPYKTLYNNRDLSKLIKLTNEEIEELVELMTNMELLDSYDQNTGELNKIYRLETEVEKLKKVCGGPKK